MWIRVNGRQVECNDELVSDTENEYVQQKKKVKKNHNSTLAVTDKLDYKCASLHQELKSLYSS